MVCAFSVTGSGVTGLVRVEMVFDVTGSSANDICVWCDWCRAGCIRTCSDWDNCQCYAYFVLLGVVGLGVV